VKKFFFIAAILIFGYVQNADAQIGGTSTYRFLDLPSSAKIGSLGGNNISLEINDINLSHNNPALLKPLMDNNLSLNFVPYFADIKLGYVAYAKDFENAGTFGCGIHYINYGKFTEADYIGNKLGEFTAAEYAIDIIWSKPIDSLWTFGINMKPIYSVLERYTSFGLAFDVGVNYYKPSKLFSFGIVVKNLGTQIKPYYQGHYEKLPFDLQMGITKKLEHAPFRISVTAQNLQKLNLNYTLPDDGTIEISTEENADKNDWYITYPEMAMRHLILGLEFIPMKSFVVGIGYNHRRRQEMKLETKSGFTGISWGIAIYMSKFQIEYGRACYHLAGASNLISVKLKFNEFFIKKAPATY
jgi:long-subunit fatty acid transport protein